MSANTEKCSDKDKTYCEYNEFRRLRYFHGMLLDDKDFRAEQQYHAGKRRFLNRMLHGSGVVCGLELTGKKGKRFITLKSGLAFDCSGNEIWVPEPQEIDLATLVPPKKSKAEECGEEYAKNHPNTYYIGIRYQESQTSPVSVYLPSGDCEEKTCENSRWKEGYCIEIVNCCRDEEKPGLLVALCNCEDKPDKTMAEFEEDLCGKCGGQTDQSTNPQTGADNTATINRCKCLATEQFCEQSVPCGECCSCDKPCYVILGQIEVDNKCQLTKLCMNECRRYVLTGRFVQNLLVRIFSGAEGQFQIVDGNTKVPFPKGLAEYIYNPIKALCWWLPYKKGIFTWLGCVKTDSKDPKTEEKPIPVIPNAEIDKAIRGFETRMAERMEKRIAEQMQLRLKPITDRLDLIEKPGALEVPPTAAKPQQAKPPKKPGT